MENCGECYVLQIGIDKLQLALKQERAEKHALQQEVEMLRRENTQLRAMLPPSAAMQPSNSIPTGPVQQAWSMGAQQQHTVHTVHAQGQPQGMGSMASAGTPWQGPLQHQCMGQEAMNLVEDEIQMLQHKLDEARMKLEVADTLEDAAPWASPFGHRSRSPGMFSPGRRRKVNARSPSPRKKPLRNIANDKGLGMGRASSVGKSRRGISQKSVNLLHAGLPTVLAINPR